jgi:hypothetical protein
VRAGKVEQFNGGRERYKSGGSAKNVRFLKHTVQISRLTERIAEIIVFRNFDGATIVQLVKAKDVTPGRSFFAFMTSPNPLRRVRWAWALPLLALAVNVGLVLLAVRQNTAFLSAHPGVSWYRQAPATLFAQLLNGPGFFLPWPFAPLDADWIRLPGVILFWAWLGRGLDRRLRGVQTKSNHSSFRRGLSYAAVLGLAMLFAWGFLTCLHRQ